MKKQDGESCPLRRRWFDGMRKQSADLPALIRYEHAKINYPLSTQKSIHTVSISQLQTVLS